MRYLEKRIYRSLSSRISKGRSILAACTDGIAVIRDNKVERVYDESDGISNTEILTVAEGKNGDILAGTDGGGTTEDIDNIHKRLDIEYEATHNKENEALTQDNSGEEHNDATQDGSEKDHQP